MRKRTGDFGHLKLILAFLFISVVLPNVVKAFDSSAASALGSFEANETGIKLCAQIDAGPEDALHFRVSNNQGYSTDLVVANNSCAHIDTEAATYSVKQLALQEYLLSSVTGGTVSADNMPFVATASGQYSIIYSSHYAPKSYLHSFGYTVTKNSATAMDVHFDANGGTGTMNDQRFGINASQALTANAFTRADYTFDGWNTAADGSGTSYADEQSVSFANGGTTTLYAQWEEAKLLYNRVASQTNGILSLDSLAVKPDNSTNGSGDGVFTYEPSEHNQYPVYYYRGSVANENSVIFADFCWRIIRTTDTGGVKIMYAGVPSGTGANRQCPETANGINDAIYKFNDAHHYYSALYMYGSDEDVFPTATSTDISGGDTITIYKGAHLENGLYTFDDSITDSFSNLRSRILSEAYRYVCRERDANGCTAVGFITSTSQTSYSYVPLGVGYSNVRELLDDTVLKNEHSSQAKLVVDEWFSNNLLTKEDKLEDTVFCIDRDIHRYADRPVDPNTSSGEYLAYQRNNSDNHYRGAFQPTLDCVNRNDSFTKNASEKGNGALDYSVGLITMDEAVFAGAARYGWSRNTTSYLGSVDTWTASPAYAGGSSYPVGLFANGNRLYENYPPSQYALKPVVSLKPATRYTSGTGATTNPYIVE